MFGLVRKEKYDELNSKYCNLLCDYLALNRSYGNMCSMNDEYSKLVEEQNALLRKAIDKYNRLKKMIKDNFGITVFDYEEEN